MKIFPVLLCLVLLGVSQAQIKIRPISENFFKQHGIETDCRGNTTFGPFSFCGMRCDTLQNPSRDCDRPSQLGCKCKRGFIPLSSNLNPLRCVRLYDCPA
ncbi:hypothetical protein AVEN_193759-1 [Araneus ventricosus]|uniref:TIL domain-containing protein n=1 Tax=Araneus ventricosus TaxID=182803 RepID=A0A4Y2DKZ3_ARAVE|nr:hypothetical protein AVEN_193759-1 [Araneus ventricosus]